MVAVGVGELHDDLEVLLCKADLVDGALPEDSIAVLLELHLAVVLGEHAIDVHLHLSVVDALLSVVRHNAYVVDVEVEWL